MTTNVRATGREAPHEPYAFARESARAATARDETTPGLFISAWRFRWLSLAITFAVAGTSALAGVFLAAPPTASAVISLTNPQPANVLAPGVVGDATLTRYTAQRADYITSNDVLRDVSSATGLTIDTIRHRLSVSPSSTSSVITVVATGSSRVDAVTLANGVVASYRTDTRSEVTRRTDAVTASIDADVKKINDGVRGLSAGSPEAQAAAQSIAALQSKASGIRTDNVSYGDGVDWATQPTENDVVVAGPPFKESAIGLMIGLAASMVIAWLLSDRKRQVVTSGRAGELLEVPLLGVSNRVRKPDAATAELAFTRQKQSLATASIALRARTDEGSIVVVGVGGGIATHDVALGIATGLTLQGNSTLIVEADFSQESRAEVDDGDDTGTGFATMLADTQGVTTPRTRGIDVGQGLSLELMRLGAIPPGTSWHVGGLPIALATLQEGRDFIVIDGGGLDSGHITAALVAACDALVFVIPDHSNEDDVIEARVSVETLQANLVGYVYVESDDD